MQRKLNLMLISFELKDGGGEVKEYYENKELKFDGEYLYGYKIKGKQYVNDKLEYEGEYLFDNIFNGKFYDKSGNKKFKF